MKGKEDFKLKDQVVCIDSKSKSIFQKIGTVAHVGTDKKIGVEFNVKILPKQKIAFKCKKPENCALLDPKQIMKLPKDVTEANVAEFLKQNKVVKAKPKKKPEEQVVEFDD